MTKEEFQAWCNAWVDVRSPLQKRTWESTRKVLESHDPKLAALYATSIAASNAMQAYLEGRREAK